MLCRFLFGVVSTRVVYNVYFVVIADVPLILHPPPPHDLNLPTQVHIARLIGVVIRGQFRGCLGTTPSPNAAIIKLGIYIKYIYLLHVMYTLLCVNSFVCRNSSDVYWHVREPNNLT